MKKSFSLALHIFRRDLRLHDNTALIAALKASDQVLPCFIFDPRQIEHNNFKSNHSIQFMLQSLIELNQALENGRKKLYFFYGKAEDVIKHIIDVLAIDAVFINRDYTPFSLERDHKIQAICKAMQVKFHCYADALLNEPEMVTKSDGTPYSVFTPFFRKAQENSIEKPQSNHYDNYYHHDVTLADQHILQKLSRTMFNPALLVKGGRQEALSLLKQIKKLQDYKLIRDYPALDGTTKLSAHNKFGTISIREFYHEIVKHFGKAHALIGELYWRDFFTHIGYHFPRVFGLPFHEKYNDLKWSQNEKHFRAWCEGNTGFPIVDAGMRELNTTGFMHNRVRMITASFLTKDLHINWLWGEKYFAQKLTDYDACINNGNWQWAASTGCDAQPYFRIFNPWLQQQKYDPECLYIKRFIPELARVPNNAIFDPKQMNTLKTNYPTPIINHAVESQKAIADYKRTAAKIFL